MCEKTMKIIEILLHDTFFSRFYLTRFSQLHSNSTRHEMKFFFYLKFLFHFWSSLRGAKKKLFLFSNNGKRDENWKIHTNLFSCKNFSQKITFFFLLCCDFTLVWWQLNQWVAKKLQNFRSQKRFFNIFNLIWLEWLIDFFQLSLA